MSTEVVRVRVQLRREKNYLETVVEMSNGQAFTLLLNHVACVVDEINIFLKDLTQFDICLGLEPPMYIIDEMQQIYR